MRILNPNSQYTVWILLLLTSPHLLADERTKTDVLVMKNGDRITCEIKSLSRGELLIKTDYTLDTVTVNWERVQRIESKQEFRVESSTGEVRAGTIQQEGGQTVADRKLEISKGSESAVLPHAEVVQIDQLDQGFFRQLDGSIDAGLSYTTNNNTSQVTVNASVGRRREQNEFNLVWSSFLNQVSDGEDTNRYSSQAIYKRHLKRSDWYFGGAIGFLRSDQQNLKIRFTPGGVVGRTLVRTNRIVAAVFGGGVANRETYLTPVDGVTGDLNAEGVVGSTVSIFRFNSTQLDTNVYFYPSITGASRYRVDFDSNIYLDLPGDLYLRFSFYDNFDSNPQGDIPRNDMGVTTSVGWSF